jgi:LmbE family N-acetylglucosaminyl deacetylase
MGAGIIANARANGDTVKVVVVTNGDYQGVSVGYTREGESVAAMSVLGLAESDVIFLGYGDGSLHNLVASTSAATVFISQAGQTSTYANRGLGEVDYHNYLTGSHGAYNRATIVSDIQNILSTFKPDDIYTTSLYDDHSDHEGVYLFVVQALSTLAQSNAYFPRLHETIIHAPCEFCDPNYHWPLPVFTPNNTFPIPEFLNTTPLLWDRRELIPVPTTMRSTVAGSNAKHLVIDQYPSQGGGDPTNWLYSFVKDNEFFWFHDLSLNMALTANVTASSQNIGLKMPATNAVDGIVGDNHEWSTAPGKSDRLLAPVDLALTGSDLRGKPLRPH